jgi:hypothetical protein
VSRDIASHVYIPQKLCPQLVHSCRVGACWHIAHKLACTFFMGFTTTRQVTTRTRAGLSSRTTVVPRLRRLTKHSKARTKTMNEGVGCAYFHAGWTIRSRSCMVWTAKQPTAVVAT